MSVGLSGTWQSRKGTRGAILLMYKPHIKEIPEGALSLLGQVEVLRSFYLVTKVFYCPAYALTLTTQGS